MDEFQSITRFDIESKFSKQSLLVSRIISLAMIAGSSIFLCSIYFIYLKNQTTDLYPAPSQESSLFVLVLLILAFIIYSVLAVLPKFFLNSKKLKTRMAGVFHDEKGNTINDPVLKLISFERTYMIIRLAMMEGISLFAMVILFLAVSQGEIYQNSAFWLLVIPLLIQVWFTFSNYFSKEHYINRIKTQILAPLKEI